MKLRQYKLGRSIEDGHYEEKTCWLDDLDLVPMNTVKLKGNPFWWWVKERYDTVLDSSFLDKNRFYGKPIEHREHAQIDRVCKILS